MELVLIRHGVTAWNQQRRFQGQIDTPLSDEGHQQAMLTARHLSALSEEQPIQAIYASDLSRAFQTAQAIGAVAGCKPVATPELRERHFGHFQTRTWAEIEDQWPEDAQRWRKRVPDWAPEGGESLLALSERIEQVVQKLAPRHIGQQMVLVAHGGVMDVLYRLATGQSLQAPRTWSLGNAHINRLLWTPQGLNLVGWGDDSHLHTPARDETSA